MKAPFYKGIIILLMVLVFMQTDRVNANVVHPFYVSVTEMNFNSKNNNLEISCKMFVDDLQGVLKQNYRKSVDLSNSKQQADNDKMLNDYLSKHLAILTDGKLIGLKYLGFEIESESVYCYFEAANIASPKKVVVTNQILQDYKKEQVNIMHVLVNGNRKSTKTDIQTIQATLNF